MFELFKNAKLFTLMVFGFFLILNSIYLIFLSEFQNTGAKRMRLYIVLRFLCFFIMLPVFVLAIIINMLHGFVWDDRITLDKVYWKAVNIILCILCIVIVHVYIRPQLQKAIRFLKKKDRNETKYQSIYKKTRTYLIVLMVIYIFGAIFLTSYAG